MKKIIFFVLIMLFLPTVSADVISLNSGGSNVIVLNPDTYIEGFFGCVSTTCTKLGYNCGTWTDGCGKTLTCGTCASGYTCTSGICVADAVTPGNGNGGNGAVTPANIVVDPTEINLDMAINTAVDKVIKIINLGTNQITISISYYGLTNMVILENTSLTLAGGETKHLNVRFVAPSKADNYVGKIIIGNKQVSVSLNVKTKLLLFDSNIVVLNRDYKVAQGSDLRTRVTLVPMGDPERLDVTLNYVIKDYGGEIYLTKSETVLVEKKVNFRRNFGTGSLPLGKYIVGLELVYSGGVAPSSAHFEMVQKTATDFLGSLMFILIVAILILAILIILLVIRRKKQQETQGQVQ